MNCEFCMRKVNCSKKLDAKNWCEGCVPGTVYITYPEAKEYYSWGALYRIKPEVVPCYPPWTTWNGVLQCEENSQVAQWLKAMDPHCEPAYNTCKGEKTLVPNYVRGLWTASKSPLEYCLKH